MSTARTAPFDGARRFVRPEGRLLERRPAARQEWRGVETVWAMRKPDAFGRHVWGPRVDGVRWG